MHAGALACRSISRDTDGGHLRRRLGLRRPCGLLGLTLTTLTLDTGAVHALAQRLNYFVPTRR